MRKTATCLTIFLLLLGMGDSGSAYPVANSASLEDLTKEADLICKARVVSVKPVEDEWFSKAYGFGPHATELKIISVLKGAKVPGTIWFHHYARLPTQGVSGYMPQHYAFAKGRTYIVFAKKTDDPKIFRQIWKHHRAKEDQGVLLAADELPCKDKSVSKVFWAELTGLLKSKEAKDVIYAVGQLDRMSGGSYEALSHFERKRVLTAIQPLIFSKDEKTAGAAIWALGSRNPYLTEGFATHWLATIGDGDIPGFTTWERGKGNPGGRTYWKQLASVVDSHAPVANRALAARALGLAGQPAVLPLALQWIQDPAPEVREAAAVLLSDFPDRVKNETLRSLTMDSSALVRLGAAHAIGFGRFVELLPELGRLLHDTDPRVRRAAALSLMSYSVIKTRKILEANLEDSPYAPLFVNALARKNPEPYLEALGKIVRGGLQPDNWWGGGIPWGVSWNILFKYAQGQEAKALRSGSLDEVFEALESPLSGNRFFSSSEPRDLYALYLQKGLDERAKKFRAACKKAISYDIDYYFDMVDKSPSTYKRY